MAFVKKNLAYLCCAAVGLLNFLWMLIDYAAGEMLGVKASMTGYDILDNLSEGSDITGATFMGVMTVVTFVLGIIILAYGVCGILKALGIFKAFPDQIAGICTKKIAAYLAIAFALAEVLLLVAIIIFCSAEIDLGIASMENPYELAAGIFVALAVALVGAAAPIVAEKLIKE